MRNHFLMGVCALLLVQASHAATVVLLSHETLLDVPAQTVTFNLTFDRTPALHTYDAVLRPQDEFGIDILGTEGFTSIGPAISHIYSGEYLGGPAGPPSFGRIAVPDGFVALTDSGNLLLNLVPAVQNGASISFTVGIADLGDANGIFDARLNAYRFGGLGGPTIYVGNALPPLPLPPALAAFPFLMLCGLVIHLRSRLPANARQGCFGRRHPPSHPG